MPGASLPAPQLWGLRLKAAKPRPAAACSRGCAAASWLGVFGKRLPHVTAATGSRGKLVLGSPPRCCLLVLLQQQHHAQEEVFPISTHPRAPTPAPALPRAEPPHLCTYPTRAQLPAQPRDTPAEAPASPPHLIKRWQLGQRLYLHPCPGSCAVAGGEGGLQGGLGHAPEQARHPLPLEQLPETISWRSSTLL